MPTAADRILDPRRSRRALRAGRTHPVPCTDGYQRATGTSFAAPFVAAAAALLVARAQSRSPPIDGALVRELLVESATPFSGGPVAGCGAGILNAAAALSALDAWIDRRFPTTAGSSKTVKWVKLLQLDVLNRLARRHDDGSH